MHVRQSNLTGCLAGSTICIEPAVLRLQVRTLTRCANAAVGSTGSCASGESGICHGGKQRDLRNSDESTCPPRLNRSRIWIGLVLLAAGCAQSPQSESHLMDAAATPPAKIPEP